MRKRVIDPSSDNLKTDNSTYRQGSEKYQKQIKSKWKTLFTIWPDSTRRMAKEMRSIANTRALVTAMAENWMVFRMEGVSEFIEGELRKRINKVKKSRKFGKSRMFHDWLW